MLSLEPRTFLERVGFAFLQHFVHQLRRAPSLIDYFKNLGQRRLRRALGKRNFTTLRVPPDVHLRRGETELRRNPHCLTPATHEDSRFRYVSHGFSPSAIYHAI